MSVASEQAALSRQPIWMLRLIMDQCTLENGVAPCTATVKCFFTFATSQDLPNYTNGTRNWDFVNRGAPYLPETYPYLMEPIKFTATMINQTKFKTERGVMQFRLQEDNAWPLANPNKTTSQTDSGRFWRNWIARNPNYHGRIAELYRGYAGVDKADFELWWRGRIDTIDFNKDGIEIRVIDLLFKAAEEKYPNKISDDNFVLDDPLAAGETTRVLVADETEFYDATVNEPRHIKIEDEIIEYTSKAGGANRLSGITRGAHLTTAVEHAQETKIKQIMIHAQPGFTREPPDHIFMDMLCNLAGIDAAQFIETKDVGLTIDDAGGITAGDTTIGVSNVALLPFEGAVLIESEMIRYSNVSGNNLIECKRGMYGTDAAGHADSVDVEPTSFTHEIGKWLQGFDSNTHVESPKAIKKFITDLQTSVMCDVWQNKAGKIECKMQAPPIGEPVTAYINPDMIENSRKVDRDEDSRITRVSAYYDQNEVNPGTDPLKFDGLRKHIDAPAESEDSFNEVREKVFYLPFTFTQASATRLVDRYFQRFRAGCPIISFSLELREDDTDVGDIVSITVPEIVDKDSNQNQPLTRLYRIIKKLQVGKSTLKFMARDTGFGTDKFRLIGPKNGILDAGINDSTTQIDVDLAATDLAHAGWRTDGTHHINIGNEKISYTTATDLGGSVTRLTGGARGVDGTANVGHSGGVDVMRLFSACADADRGQFGFIGNAADNLLDGDGDLTAEVQGHIIY